VLIFLTRVIGDFLERHQLGLLLVAPFLMRLPHRPSGREPDIMFIANEHADRVQNTYIDGPADLVIEIVSPDSEVRDRGEKFVEYETAGIPEYWVIDHRRRQAYFYQLNAEAAYDLIPIEADGIYRSAVLRGFWLRPDWLWQQPLPPVGEIVRQLGL
jgi:Uma2 family endonuclease